jgi:predicted HTH domain antitoxin
MVVEIENDKALKKGDAKGLILEIALSLYGQQAIGIGFATEIAGITRAEFQRQLAERGIDINFSEEMVLQDIEFAKSFSG